MYVLRSVKSDSSTQRIWGLFISLEVYENLVNDSFHTII